MENVLIPRINVLPENIANQIAAGEVVERPASVVKELIENSIDAGANRIKLHISGGGLKEIRVIDNGHGIMPDDIPYAFERYATSKIKDVDDLNRLSTLGFRGEALASIASVSMITLITRTRFTDTAKKIQLEGMDLINEEEVAHPVGTDITVRNLFYNVPARLKHIKKIETEFSRIQEFVSILAMSRPDIHFELYNEKKKKLFLPVREKLIERISDILGRETSKELISLRFSSPNLNISGFISKPRISRNNRRMQYFFVNKRNISAPALSHSLSNALRGTLETGRYPVAVVYISLPPDRVDFNVHPQKKEARFLDESSLYKALYHTVRDAITSSDLAPRVDIIDVPEDVKPELNLSPVSSYNETKQKQKKLQKQIDIALTNWEKKTEPSSEEQKRVSLLDEDVHVIGQFALTYILAENTAGELILYDQHTVHERVLYERFMKRFAEHKVEKQTLLVPVTLELGARGTSELMLYLDKLNEIGFEIEEFGSNTFIIRAVPVFLGKRANDKRILFDIIDDITLQGKKIPQENMIDSIVNIMACRAAVKSGERLLPEEMSSIINELKDCYLPYTCPHGRPVFIKLHRNELDKRFHRPIKY